VTGRLKAAQDRERAPESEAAAGKLLYTAEQWRAFEKKKKEDGAGSSRDGDRPRGGKKNKTRGGDKGGDQGGDADRGGEKAEAGGDRRRNRDDLCLNCSCRPLGTRLPPTSSR